MQEQNNPDWLKLRSDIYIRDKGICWVCNSFVDLKDYDLGHLIDRCNGGMDAYDNLTVMHHSCNIAKPRHTTLEQAMKWKLTPSYLIERPLQKQLPKKITYHEHFTRQVTRRYTIYSQQDFEAIAQLIIEYFQNKPELLTDEKAKERIQASRQLSSTFDISTHSIRNILINSSMLSKHSPIIPNDNEYYYIHSHLDELLDKFRELRGKIQLWHISKPLGLTRYGLSIMFYFAGMEVTPKDLKSISKRAAKLNLPIKYKTS